MNAPFVHPLALVHGSVSLGDGTNVWAFASVHDHTTIGSNCAVGEHVYIGWHARIGNSVRIQQGAHLTSRIQIGDRVFIGPHVVTTDDKHPFVNNPHYKPCPPVIEDDVSIGANVTLLPGVRLGQGCRIGAGAVVTRDVPPFETWVGAPAHPVRPRSDWNIRYAEFAEENV
jgi:acetyltransferase-like isoleucine patch superfamily enzyme